MSTTPTQTFGSVNPLDEVIAAYLKVAAAGAEPEQQEWLARYPQYAKELAEFFADRARFERWAKPVRDADPAHAATIAPHNAIPAVGATVRYVGDYELLEELARGGMGVVFKARQVSLNRIVALKMILGGQFASAGEVQRFRAEAEAAGNLDHPNIVPIYEVGEFEGQQYFSMKLIEGGSLAYQLSSFCREPKASVGTETQSLIQLLATVARAVHHAHQRGIIHRDLKPANVLVDADGQPHVTDFGLAKQLTGDSEMTHTGQIVGTPSYMAPEQASGKKGTITTATDIYSLGAILYEMLTGQPPFRGDNVMETLQRVQVQEPELPSRLRPRIDRDLEAVCLKCLAKDPQMRYASAAALAEDLDHWLAGEPISVRPPTLTKVVWSWLRKNVRAAVWTTLIGVVCGGFGAALLSLLAMGNIFKGMANSYAKFPSLTPPALARDVSVPVWLELSGGFIGGGLIASMGLLTVWLVRPKDRRNDLNAGLGVGLVAGIASFTVGLGPACVLAMSVVVSLVDIKTFSEAALTPAEQEMDKPPAVVRMAAQENLVSATACCQPNGWADLLQLVSVGPAELSRLERAQATGAHATQAIASRYADMAERTHRERANFFFSKVIADLCNGVFTGIWVGIIISLVGCGGLATAETLAAGYLLRRGRRWWTIPIPYVEMSVALAIPIFWLVAKFAYPPSASYAMEWLLLFVLAAVALTGIVYGWSWLLRWLLYGAWYLTGLCAVEGPDLRRPFEDVFWIGGIVAWVSVAVLLASYHDWRRQRVGPMSVES